jgi:hypothetical protein
MYYYKAMLVWGIDAVLLSILLKPLLPNLTLSYKLFFYFWTSKSLMEYDSVGDTAI